MKTAQEIAERMHGELGDFMRPFIPLDLLRDCVQAGMDEVASATLRPLDGDEAERRAIFSRRYTCPHCGHKARSNNKRRGPVKTCARCLTKFQATPHKGPTP